MANKNNWNFDNTSQNCNSSLQPVFNCQPSVIGQIVGTTPSSTNIFDQRQQQQQIYQHHPSHLTPLSNLHYNLPIQNMQSAIQLPPISHAPGYYSNYQLPANNNLNHQPPTANGNKDFNSLAFALGMSYFNRSN